MTKYLEEFYILAGNLNKAPRNLEDETKSYIVSSLNPILEMVLDDPTIGYYRKLMDNVTVSLLLIDELQNPGEHCLKRNEVINDLTKTKKRIEELLNIEYGMLQPINIVEILKTSFSWKTAFFINQNFNYSNLTNDFIQAYINLVIAFFNKIRQRAWSIAKLSNLDEVLAYVPEEICKLFSELYNYLIKNIKSIRDIKVGANEQFTSNLIINTRLMQIITGILNNESDLVNYDLYHKLTEESPNIKYDEAYIREWIYSLEIKNRGIVLQ